MPYEFKYEPARGPTAGPEPGTTELMRWALDEFEESTNLGIYNPRKVRGSRSTWSVHAEGRAIDVGFPVVAGGHPEGHRLASLLVDRHLGLGVQQVIWAHRVWTVGRGWRKYNGTSPHLDHLHGENCREAAATLTGPMIERATRPILEDPEMIAELYAAYKTGGRAPSPNELTRWVRHLQTSGQDLTETCLWIAHTVANERPNP